MSEIPPDLNPRGHVHTTDGRSSRPHSGGVVNPAHQLLNGLATAGSVSSPMSSSSHQLPYYSEKDDSIDACMPNCSGTSGLMSSQSVLTSQDPHPEHSKMILRGLNTLRRDHVLCDVTLTAEGEKFEVHKVILVSCSDYFRSMFTSGMKETKQKEIELKGVTAKGLEKVLDIIYTSTTKIEGDDVFDIIAAATHLQVTPVIEFCEQNFLSGMNTSNFYDFINTARLYNMTNVLTQIDRFIARNLLRIAEEGTLNLLTYEQVLNCVRSSYCALIEIELFDVIWEWIGLDPGNRQHYAEQLMTEIRFKLISPTDIVQKVQSVPIMMQNPRLRDMVLKALNYHVIPFAQPLSTGSEMELRCYKERIVCVGGREIHPHPGLSEDLVILPLYEQQVTGTSLVNKKTLSHLPTAVSHGQVIVFNNFLFVLGGCTTQCAHGESAVNMVMRFDPRFMCWYQCEGMIHKRAYFFAGVVKKRIIAVGGRRKEGSLAFCEMYNPEDNTWEAVASLQSPFHAHAGVVYKDLVYISGGYSNDNFYPDMQRYDINSNQWDDMAPMLTARGWHVMCAAGDKIYVAGGCSLNANNQALPVLQCEQYDPCTDMWTVISPLSVSHKEANCVLFHDSIYILGGYNTQMKTGQKLVSRYDLRTGLWDSVGTFQTSMTGVGACILKLPGFYYQFDDI